MERKKLSNLLRVFYSLIAAMSYTVMPRNIQVTWLLRNAPSAITHCLARKTLFTTTTENGRRGERGCYGGEPGGDSLEEGEMTPTPPPKKKRKEKKRRKNGERAKKVGKTKERLKEKHGKRGKN